MLETKMAIVIERAEAEVGTPGGDGT